MNTAAAITMFEKLERGELVAEGDPLVFKTDERPTLRTLSVKAIPSTFGELSLKIEAVDRWVSLPRWHLLAESTPPQRTPEALWGAVAALLREASSDEAHKEYKGKLTEKQLGGLLWIGERPRPHETDFRGHFHGSVLTGLKDKGFVEPRKFLDYTLCLTPKGKRALVALDAS